MSESADLFGRPERLLRTIEQLPLPLGWRTRDDEAQRLLIDEPTRALINSLLDWRSWSSPIAVLRGPARSGKSLLARHVANEDNGITVIDPASGADEADLFHRATGALAGHAPLLLVTEPAWCPSLPDLQTRTAAAQDFVIPEPEPQLIAALLIRRLADHRAILTWECAAWLAARMERTFIAVAAVGDALVAAAIADPRPMSMSRTRALASDLGLVLLTDDGVVAV